ALDAAQSDPVLVVLKSSRNAKVRLRIVQTDSVKFSGREFVQVIPIFSAGKTLIKPAVSSEQQSLTNWWFRRFVFILRLWRFLLRNCARLDREGVAIGMDFFGKIFAEIFSAVIGN